MRERFAWFSDINVGLIGALSGTGVCRPFWPVLHALAELIDDAGSAASAHIASSAAVRQPATQGSDEATFDQLHRVEGADKCLAQSTLFRPRMGLRRDFT